MPSTPMYSAAPLGGLNGAIIAQGSTVQSLTNQSGVVQGTALNNGVAYSNHNMVVTTGAGVSAGTVTLMGSNDNVNWFATTATVSTIAASTRG